MEKQRKKLKIGLVVAFCVLVFIAFGAIMFWVDWKKANAENNAYIDYVCCSNHLVALKQEDCVGYYDIQAESSTCRLYYHPIKSVSSTDFVNVKIDSYMLFAPSYYQVFQGNQNQIDVFKDWSIKEVQLYYCKTADFLDSNYEQIPVEKWKIHKFASSTDEVFLQKIHELPLNKAPEVASVFKNSDNTYKCIEDDKKLYMRILFEESEYLAWDVPFYIYQSKTDENDLLVVVHTESMDANYVENGGRWSLDSSSELYKFIIEAFGEW